MEGVLGRAFPVICFIIASAMGGYLVRGINASRDAAEASEDYNDRIEKMLTKISKVEVERVDALEMACRTLDDLVFRSSELVRITSNQGDMDYARLIGDSARVDVANRDKYCSFARSADARHVE